MRSTHPVSSSVACAAWHFSPSSVRYFSIATRSFWASFRESSVVWGERAQQLRQASSATPAANSQRTEESRRRRRTAQQK